MAAFNIVAMLVMVVNDKRTDIAILRTFGASPRAIMQAFITQGLAIGWLGVGAGVVARACCWRSTSARIVPVLERLLHFQFLDCAGLLHHQHSVRGAPARRRLDQRRGLDADAAVDDLSGAARRAHAAGRRAALRVDPAWPTNGCSARATCARRAGRGFLSFISVVSVLGLAIGVAVLIVVLSVMNGFERELKTRILSVTSHATLTGPERQR